MRGFSPRFIHYTAYDPYLSIGRILREISAQQMKGEKEKAAAMPSLLPPASKPSPPVSVLQADSQLAVGFVDGVDRVHAMPAKVVSGMLKVVLGVMKCAQRIFNLRMFPGRGRWRG